MQHPVLLPDYELHGWQLLMLMGHAAGRRHALLSTLDKPEQLAEWNQAG